MPQWVWWKGQDSQAWLDSIHLYLLINQALYHDGDRKITYALLYMKKGSTAIWAEVHCQQGFANQSFGTFATFKTNFKKPLEMPISSRKPWAGLLPLTLPQGNNSRSTPISSSWMLSTPSMTRLRMPPPWSATICYDRGPPYFFLTIYLSRLYTFLPFLLLLRFFSLIILFS